MSRQHGQTAYYVEGEGFVGDDPVGVRSLPLTGLRTTNVEASAEEAERAFRFSRMFDLPKFRPNQEALIALGRAMDETASVEDHPDLPAGFTYFGQFVDHDLTFDQTQGIPEGELSPEEIVQGRSPSLDLDSLYGRGPDHETKRLYADDKIRMRIGQTSSAGSPDEAEGLVLPNDLPRGDNRARLVEATIGDPRNDENLAVAQTHLAFLKFHNAVVDRLAQSGSTGAGLFTEARRIVTMHYQWIVLHDYLPRLVEQEVLQDVLTNGRKFYKIEPGKEPAMPLEFSVAAYRLGHSMIRDSYSWNRNFEPGSLSQIFFFSGGPPTSNMGGDLPSNWIIDWRRFYDFSGIPGVEAPPALNRTRPIDTALAIELTILPEFADAGDKASLAIRNLLRARLVGLPSGQAVAEAMDIAALTPEQMLQGRHAAVLRAHGFDTQTPLWYYILKEAEVLHRGERLGPVGSRILAETFVGLVEASQISILSSENAGFRPTLPSRQAGHFTMVDLLLFVNDLNPLGPNRQPPPTEDTIYTVQPGDSLGLIARRFLGSRSRWPEIFNINRDTIQNPDRLRVGMVLRIPIQLGSHIVERGESLRTIAALRLGDDDRWPEIFDINRDRIQNPDLLRVGQELRVRNPRPIHVVQPGETLGSIAALFFGDAGRWREIFEANRDRIQHPDRIRVGQRLVIPLPT